MLLLNFVTTLMISTLQLPINRPICPILNHNRDGKARHRIVPGSINYWPNRKEFGKPVATEKGYIEYVVSGICRSTTYTLPGMRSVLRASNNGRVETNSKSTLTMPSFSLTLSLLMRRSTSLTLFHSS
jgi:hypothetical protein